MKIHKGDEVVVIAGKDIGKRGEVTRVLVDLSYRWLNPRVRARSPKP